MTDPRHTSVLAVLLVALLAVDGLAWRAASVARAPLPRLEGFAAELATALVLVHGDERIRLERGPDGWDVVQPYRHPADPAAVDAVLGTLARGVHPDARLGTALDDYGLEGADPIRVEAHGDAGPLTALYVGHDAPGGASFVRFPGSEAAFRARVGGRSRFDLPARAWRDRTLWTTDRVVAWTVDRDDGQRLEVVRAGTGWGVADDPAFPVDPSLADALGAALAHLEATEVLPGDHPSGLDRPTATLTVRGADGTERVATLALSGSGSAAEAFAGVADRDAAYRLPPRLVERLVADREAWRDRTLWTMTGVRELEWLGPDGAVRLSLDPRSGAWVRRDGGPVEARAVGAVAAWLARPRAEVFVDVDPAAVGLPGERSLVVLGDRAETLQLGDPAPGALDGRDGVHVRAASAPDRVGLVEAELIDRLLGALGAR